jgi:hypothetical protein
MQIAVIPKALASQGGSIMYDPLSVGASPVTGALLGHCGRRPLVARAFDGLSLWRGPTYLVDPLLSQAARIACTSAHAITLAAVVVGEPDLQAAVLLGDLTLAQAAREARARRPVKSEPAMPTMPAVSVESESALVMPVESVVPMPEVVPIEPAPAIDLEIAVAAASDSELAAALAVRAAWRGFHPY